MTEGYPKPPVPPDKLVEQWCLAEPGEDIEDAERFWRRLIDQAIAWATPIVADQQLEADMKWINGLGGGAAQNIANNLRAAMRPKPPSLKQQALELLPSIDLPIGLTPDQASTIRQALEALPDDN